MRRWLPVLTLLLASTVPAYGKGLLIPEDKQLPPLAMVNHKVTISIEDQVAITHLEQTFRNHTDRELEATYIFPVPKGASVNKFTMWVAGKEVSGEMLEAAKARAIYTSIVQRTQDPGLLEYMGQNLMRMRVFPIPRKGDQKVAISYTSVAPKEGNLIEYIYPLKTDGKATKTLEEFAIQATIKSQHAIQNVYSPTHAITLSRSGDKEVKIGFERNQALLDKDFQLFYSLSDKDIGLTALTHRPLSKEHGYFTLLISPRVELPKDHHIPRDMVFVLDTSGSMAGEKMEQAKKALTYCLNNLNPKDHFALINFSTTVNRYRDGLLESSPEQIEHAKKWVNNLRAAGGTAIDASLSAAMEMRSKDESRSFTVVFFTDGLPTIGETNAEKILKNVNKKNTENTRIFTFGVGDDVDATMLDRLAENTRAVSTYVRPVEDIEAKVTSLYGKISHPILANLKVEVTNLTLSEVYPPKDALPDLFHGGQVVVMGRYEGHGPAAIRLTGTVGKETKEFVYEMSFPGKTDDGRDFVEALWARRKVGYLLDQIRVNGEKKELVDDVVTLSKKYGIATPYTSYLIVPDGPMPVAANHLRRAMPAPGPGVGGGAVPEGLAPVAQAGQPAAPAQKVIDFAKQQQAKPGELAANRGRYEEEKYRQAGEGKGDGRDKDVQKAMNDALDRKNAYDKGREAYGRRLKEEYQSGKLGVDLAIDSNNLRNQTRLTQTALRNVVGRNCMEVGGVWIDEGFEAKMKTLAVKAMSEAYFRLLEKRPELKDVFRLGNHLVWVTPSGTALVIDLNDGKEKLSDLEIDQLFVSAKQ